MVESVATQNQNPTAGLAGTTPPAPNPGTNPAFETTIQNSQTPNPTQSPQAGNLDVQPQVNQQANEENLAEIANRAQGTLKEIADHGIEIPTTSIKDNLMARAMSGMGTVAPDAYVAGVKFSALGYDIVAADLLPTGEGTFDGDKQNIFVSVNKAGKPETAKVGTYRPGNGQLELGVPPYVTQPIGKIAQSLTSQSPLKNLGDSFAQTTIGRRVLSFSNFRVGNQVGENYTDQTSVTGSFNTGLLVGHRFKGPKTLQQTQESLNQTAQNSGATGKGPDLNKLIDAATDAITADKMGAVQAAANFADAASTAATIAGTIASAGSGTPLAVAINAAKKQFKNMSIKQIGDEIRSTVKSQLVKQINGNVGIIALGGVAWRGDTEIDMSLPGAKELASQNDGVTTLAEDAGLLFDAIGEGLIGLGDLIEEGLTSSASPEKIIENLNAQRAQQQKYPLTDSQLASSVDAYNSAIANGASNAQAMEAAAQFAVDLPPIHPKEEIVNNINAQRAEQQKYPLTNSQIASSTAQYEATIANGGTPEEAIAAATQFAVDLPPIHPKDEIISDINAQRAQQQKYPLTNSQIASSTEQYEATIANGGTSEEAIAAATQFAVDLPPIHPKDEIVNDINAQRAEQQKIPLTEGQITNAVELYNDLIANGATSEDALKQATQAAVDYPSAPNSIYVPIIDPNLNGIGQNIFDNTYTPIVFNIPPTFNPDPVVIETPQDVSGDLPSGTPMVGIVQPDGSVVETPADIGGIDGPLYTYNPDNTYTGPNGNIYTLDTIPDLQGNNDFGQLPADNNSGFSNFGSSISNGFSNFGSSISNGFSNIGSSISNIGSSISNFFSGWF